MRLTREQEEAIENYDQDLVLVAGAGAGKTMVLTEIAARLFEEKAVSPQNVAIITFTEKAAAELKRRLLDRIKKPETFLHHCPIGTIHHFAWMLLKRSDHRVSSWKLWDEVRSSHERSRMVHESLTALFQDPSDDFKKVLDEYGWHRLVSLLNEHLSHRWQFRRLQKTADDSLWQSYWRLYQHVLSSYQAHKAEHRVMDFEDIEETILDLLRMPIEQKKLQDSLRHILVDEYQDVSWAQHEIFMALHRRGYNKMIVVGDSHQSIYRFRGAEPALFERYRADCAKNDIREIPLMTNFRSAPSLIEHFNIIFSGLFPQFDPIKANRTDRNVDALRVLSLPKCRWLSETRLAEARAVSKVLHEKKKGGSAWADCAILFRTRAAMPVYESVLTEQEIPYQTQGGQYLLKQRVVLEQINLLRALICMNDKMSRYATEQSPLRESLKSEISQQKASDIARSAFFESQRAEYDYSPEERRSLLQWIALLENFEEDPLDLEDTLSLVEGLIEDEARIMTVSPQRRQENKVSLLTVHAAKGLEFSTVILADLCATMPMRRELILFDPPQGIGLRRLDHAALGLKDQFIDSKGYEKIYQDLMLQEMEESRRLLYVACTRAIDSLILPLDYSRAEKLKTWNSLLCQNLEVSRE
jgi:superfamily I DNA/RNA helicase